MKVDRYYYTVNDSDNSSEFDIVLTDDDAIALLNQLCNDFPQKAKYYVICYEEDQI